MNKKTIKKEQRLSYLFLIPIVFYLLFTSSIVMGLETLEVREGKVYFLRSVLYETKASYVEEVVSPLGEVCSVKGVSFYEKTDKPQSWGLKNLSSCYKQGSTYRVSYTAYLFNLIPLREATYTRIISDEYPKEKL